MSTSNMTMSGGGNIKSSTILPSHFRIWRHTPQRRKQVIKGKEQFASSGYGSSAPLSLPNSLGLWTEWLTTPYTVNNDGTRITSATSDNINKWMDQLNQFMTTYRSKTLVLRIQAPGSGNWTESLSYSDWLTNWGLDDGGLDKLFSGVTTLQEIHFLPYINTDGKNIDDVTQEAGYAYDFINNNLGNLTQSITNASNLLTYMCIEPENIKLTNPDWGATDNTPYPYNYWSTFPLDSNNPITILHKPNIANKTAYITALTVLHITKQSNLLLSCVSSPTVGKSINLINGVDKYIGEWYSDETSDNGTSTFYENSVQQITQSFLSKIKLADTNMSNYFAMLSIETNYSRSVSEVTTDMTSIQPTWGPAKDSLNPPPPKKPVVLARLGPQPQLKTLQLAQSIIEAYNMQNEVLIYSGAYLEQWGIVSNNEVKQLLQQSPTAIELQSL